MKEDNLLFTDGKTITVSNTAPGGGLNTTYTTKASKLNFEYAPGFKVGAGVLFDHDNWDLFADYTWLHQNHAKGHSSINGNTPSGTYNTVGGESNKLTNELSDVTHAHWSCHFNNIDLVLGRSFFISHTLVLRPHVGLKGAWIHQDFKISATSRETSNYISTTQLVQTTGQLKYHQHFWGIGLRAGLDTVWHFTPDWSLYANIAASELACRFKDTANVDAEAEGLTSHVSGTGKIKAYRAFHAIKPVLELALGLRYETSFSNDKYLFFVQTGWEQQIWWDQNQFYNLTSTQASLNGGNLTMQGLDVKLGFAF